VTALKVAVCTAALAAGVAVPLAAQVPVPSAADAAALLDDENASLLEAATRAPEAVPSVNLGQAIDLAMEGNFGLQAAGDDLSAARVRERAARAEFTPAITPLFRRGPQFDQYGFQGSQRVPWTGARVSATGTLLAPRAGTASERSSAVQVVLTQPLLRGFGPTVSGFDLENARRSRQGRERGLELARQRLVVDVTAAFYQVIRQRQLVEVASQSLRRGEALKAASEARVRVGLDSRLDVLRAELRTSQATDALISAQAGLETALEQFRILLGLAPSDELQPGGLEEREGENAEMEPIEVLVARAMEHRIELREAGDLVSDARRSRAVAAQSLLPQLDLSVSFSRYGSGVMLPPVVQSSDHRFDVAVTASYPLQRSTARAARDVADLALHARERDLRQRRLQVEAEVRASARALELIRRSIELQRKGVEFARQQYRLATLRYQRGLASNFDVIEAEGSLVSARTALANLLTDDRVARVQLRLTTGGLDAEALSE